MQQGIIGIGISEDPIRVIDSIANSPLSDRVVCYTNPDTGSQFSFPCQVCSDIDPEKRLISDLFSHHIAAAVRGTLSANITLRELKTVYGVPELERIVLLEAASGRKFFLAPVGIDEGWTLNQKIALIEKGKAIAIKSGLSGQVGILSGGRIGDVGRHPVVDRTLADAELISRVTGAIHYEIRIEDAINECGLIIAPDGISGNLIFRTLLFAGKGASHGAPVVNISDIFVDTSRVNPDYTNALILAASLMN
ncbi:MAG: methanogenesis marker protein Mmp4/MtxX [Methanospirillum sp.]|uniref:methanogenesis marker protein Mmp4/MtxX n=1 Tax=Methanospirillum sp. TaxID=45200 RepID=UPI0023721FF4|nr:methanogenesis marker protein Mmp4/MtxX [Methanospirillum sp.]MDD1727758.1 methanogenesis marker protein Mmp4/MtxX [Methanospirillum sp.]